MGMILDNFGISTTKAFEPKANSALLVIDLQNDFCPGGALPVANGDQVIEPLNRMISHAHKNEQSVFLSRDWHPLNAKHFKPTGNWPIHCVEDTPGAEFHSRLKYLGSDYVVSKGTDPEENGYSAFEGKTYFRPLDEVLRYFKVKKLYIGGLATDYCVKNTCLDARKLGYIVYLLTDTCRAVNQKPGDEAFALNEMANAGVKFTTTDEVIDKAR